MTLSFLPDFTSVFLCEMPSNNRFLDVSSGCDCVYMSILYDFRRRESGYSVFKHITDLDRRTTLRRANSYCKLKAAPTYSSVSCFLISVALMVQFTYMKTHLPKRPGLLK